VSHSGARQWRHYFECLEGNRSPGSDKEHRMHSQVSQRNASYFISEDRLARDDLDAGDLEQMVRETDGSIIACNRCGRLKEVDVDEEGDEAGGAGGLDSWGGASR